VQQLTEHDLIGLIYEAGTAAPHWQPVLDGLRQVLTTGLATLMVRDDAPRSGPSLVAMSGAPPYTYAPYGEYFAPRDPRWDYIRIHPVGQVYTDFAALPDAVFHRTEIFADFLHPNGIGRCCGVVLIRDRKRFCVVTTNLPTGEEFSANQISVMQRLAPHFARALRVHRQIEMARAEAGAARLLLDHLPTALFLLDQHGTVLRFNEAAEHLLASRPDAVRMTATGALVAGNAGSQVRLWRSLMHARAAQDGKPPPPIFRLDAPGGPLSVMVAPALGNQSLFGGENDAVCVFIADPSRTDRIDETLLTQEYDFTPAEARVVADLVAGQSVDQIATERGLARNTVYFQIKRVLGKTGAGSQAQLVSTVLRGISANARKKH
jgi:DNA-binding CsgD family transcriptional regulator/PAS domain-containing protein